MASTTPTSGRRNIKFTPSVIASLRSPDPSGKQRFLWDSHTPGFGIRISGRTATKTWVAQRTNKEGRTVRRVIERADLLPLDEARQRAVDWLLMLGAGIDPRAKQKVEQQKANTASLTLGEALTSYLTTRQGGALRPATQQLYRRMVRLHFGDWENRPIAEITRKMVAARHVQIRQSVNTRAGTSGGSSANTAMRVLRAVISNVKQDDEDFEGVDVGAALKGRWGTERRRTRHVTDSELPIFYRALHKLPNRLHRVGLEVLLLTGLRKNELLGLQWTEVDLEAATITLAAERNKSGRQFACPLSDRVTDILRALRKHGRAEGDYVFPSYGKKTGHLTELDRPLAEVGEAIGHRVSCHDLRRVFAGAVQKAGLDYTTLRKLLNHSLGADVSAGYIPPDLRALAKAQQRVTDHILKVCRATAAKPKRSIVRRRIAA